MSRKFRITMEVDVTLDIDERHLAMLMSPEWQRSYFPFDDEEDALGYLARLIILRGRVDGLDGHANLPDEWSETLGHDHDWGVMDSQEITS